MKRTIKKDITNLIVGITIVLAVSACSSPEEKAQKYYDKGMELLESNPDKAKLEFQNALQLKRNMTPAIYGLALAAEKKADWKGLFGMLNKVVQEEPTHIEANVKLGQMFLAAGNLEQAQKFLDISRKLAPDSINTILLGAAFDLKSNDYVAAVKKANIVLAKDSANKEALLVLATERSKDGDYVNTLKYINQALAADKQNFAMQMFKIKTLESMGDAPNVEKAYRNVIQMYPNNYALRTRLAQYYYDSNRKDEAQNELQVVVEKQPNLLQPKMDLLKFIAASKGPLEAKLALESMVEKNSQDYDLAFVLVDFYDKSKDTAAAEKLLKSIVSGAGDKPEGLKAKVKVAYRAIRDNKKSEANKLIDEVLEIDEGHQQALLLKASLQLDKGDFDTAILTLRRLLRDTPESVEGLFLMAKTQELAGSTALADESYVQALSASKSSANIGIPFAKSLAKRKENARAQKVLEDVLKNNPRNTDAVKFLAQLKIIDNDIFGAQELVKRAGVSQNSGLKNLIEGAIQLKEKNVAGSLDSFKKAHQASPKDMQAILAVVNTYLSNKQVNEAQKFLNSVLKEDVKNYGVKLLLAQVDAMTGDQSKSYATYESAIAENPANIRGYQGLATAYSRAGKTNKAKEVIQRGLTQLPNSFDLKMLMAELHMVDKDYAEAIKVYEGLFESNPQSMLALNNYVSVIADHETDESKIEKAYELAKQLESSNAAQFLDTMGWISFRSGKYDEAIKNLKAAVEKAPKYAVFQYHLGKAYLANGDKKDAKVRLEKALELSKNQQFDYSTELKALLNDV